MARVFRQLIRPRGVIGITGVTGAIGALYLQRNTTLQTPPKNNVLTTNSNIVSESSEQPYPFNRTDIGNGPKKYIHSRILAVEAKLASLGPYSWWERRNLQEELKRWRTPQDRRPVSEIEDTEHAWYFCEDEHAYSIQKGTEDAEKFEKLIYEEDRKRYVNSCLSILHGI